MKFIKVAVYFLLFSIVGCTSIYLASWKPANDYSVSKQTALTDSIISSANYYRHASHIRPYIIRGKSFVIFGCTHTRDPNHFEIGLIEKEWQQFRPTVALVEGRLGFEIPGVMNAVKNSGEGGKVRQLAKKDGIPIYNWDLPKEQLAKQLLSHYKAEQIALAQILNPHFGQIRFGKPKSSEKFIREYIDRAKYVGLEDSIQSVEDVNRIWKKYFPDKEWQDVDDQYPLPGFLAEMAYQSGDLRNVQLISAVNELLSKGERVFVSCGSGHAVCVKPAFPGGVIVDGEEFVPHKWNDADWLNNMAWTYYQSKSSEAELQKAIKWVKRSIEVKASYENSDTYAWLLYKQGLTKEALSQAQKAIEFAKTENKNYTETNKLIEVILSKQE